MRWGLEEAAVVVDGQSLESMCFSLSMGLLKNFRALDTRLLKSEEMIDN